MSGAVNIIVARPRPSLPWQLAQLTRIMPPPPIMPPPVVLPLRGMSAPLASWPVWKMISPRETEEPVPEGPTAVPPLFREFPTMSTPVAASTATASATPTIQRLRRGEDATGLEVAELLQVLLALDLAGGVAPLEDVLGRLGGVHWRRRNARRVCCAFMSGGDCVQRAGSVQPRRQN